MIVISAQEFNHQASHNGSSLEKVYHNKVLTPGVIFSLRQKEAAINYCLKWMDSNPYFLCILVEDSDRIQVWYERIGRNVLTRAQDRLFRNHSSRYLLESQNLQIDRNFVFGCEQVLARFIGPIAKIIIKKVLSQNDKCNRKNFIANLVLELQQKKLEEYQDIKEKLNELLYKL